MRKPSWAVTTAILSLTAAAVCTPAAANAKFTDSVTATVTASTASLRAPDMTTGLVHMDCDPSGGQKKMRLVIDQFPTVQGANTYQLLITDRNGAVTVISQADALANSYAVPANGPWTYAIRGSYQVAGSTNVWTGAASAPAPFAC